MESLNPEKYDLFSNQKVRKMNFFQKIAQNFKFLLFGESVIRER